MYSPKRNEHLEIEGCGEKVLKKSGFPQSSEETYFKVDGQNESVDALLESFAAWTHIRSIRVAGCENFTGEGFHYLAKLSQLNIVNVIACPNFTGEDLRCLHGIANLELIKYSFGSFGVTDAGVRAACGFPTLESLQLVQCHGITGDTAFEEIRRLEGLYQMSIVACPHLRRLVLDGLSENFDWLELSDCPVLEEIHISHSPAAIKRFRENPFWQNRSLPALRRIVFDGVEQPISD